MRVYMNYTEVRGPYGGANAFLRTLRAGLERRGIVVTTNSDSHFDVALLNALTDDIRADFAHRIAERGIPVVHRKVCYRASGPPDMRATDPDGVIHGDRLQLDFSPYLAHTIFQSEYSRAVFAAGGFDGPATVIHNGVDERVFHQLVGWGPFRRRRPGWDGAATLRVVVSTWSTDALKGFEEYARIDEAFGGHDDVELTFVGRLPDAFAPRNARTRGPFPRRRLAHELRRAHVLLQLARWETCSNAVVEGINCGLPVIFLDSGSNRELAADYGVEYRGDFFAALEEMRSRYGELFARTASNPYRSELVVPRYVGILEEAVG